MQQQRNAGQPIGSRLWERWMAVVGLLWLILVLFSCFGCAKPMPKRVTPNSVAPCNRIDPDCQPLRVTIHLCAATDDTPECAAKLAHWQWMKTARDMTALIIDEFKDESQTGGTLDLSDKDHEGRRDHIAALAEYLRSHKYD